MKVVVDINALPCNNGKDCTECAFYSTVDICEMTTALRSFPKYEERPHGEWVKKDIDFGMCWATCSVCNKVSKGEAHDNGFGNDYFYPNFCPNCGADMRGETE